MIAAALVGALVISPATAAHAGYHIQHCTKDNGEGCYDVSGAPNYYYPWFAVQTNKPYYSGTNYLCAGGRKTDGTPKNGTACSSGPAVSFGVSFATPSIVSQAYGWWRGTGPPQAMWIEAWS